MDKESRELGIQNKTDELSLQYNRWYLGGNPSLILFALLHVSPVLLLGSHQFSMTFFLVLITNHFQRNVFPFCAQDDDPLLFLERKLQAFSHFFPPLPVPYMLLRVRGDVPTCATYQQKGLLSTLLLATCVLIKSPLQTAQRTAV